MGITGGLKQLLLVIAQDATTTVTVSPTASTEGGVRAQRSTELVIVIGLPRSGTTYLFSLLER